MKFFDVLFLKTVNGSFVTGNMAYLNLLKMKFHVVKFWCLMDTKLFIRYSTTSCDPHLMSYSASLDVQDISVSNLT